MTSLVVPRPAATLPGRATARPIGSAMVAFGVFLSSFVINEPAPYELFMAGLVGFWFMLGLKITRTTGLLLAFMDCVKPEQRLPQMKVHARTN